MISLIWNNVELVCIGLVVVGISQLLYRWSNPNLKSHGKLPPGSMGFPIIGETIDFFKPCGLLEIPPFFHKRMLRYGSLFRTNILGSKTVITTDADVIYEIFRQENESFVFSYPEIFIKVLGKDNLFFKTGDIHKHVKKTTMHLIGSEGLKRNMIVWMNNATREHLRLKVKEGTFDLREAVANLILSYMTPKLISNLKKETQEKLIEHFKAFNIDWFRSPFAFSSWKTIYKALKAHREATQMIKEALKKRKESREKHGDFLDTLLEESEKEDSIYDQDNVINLLLTIGVIPKDSTSVTTALTVNLISKHPKVLEELKREHEAILENREDKDAGITWEEYKHKLTFTNMVINESLRLSNLGPMLFRKCVKDVEIKGYTIPKDWIVAVAPSVVHYNPTIYENPLDFNPWRWEGKDLRSVSKTLMVFGGGMRQCVGAEFTRLHMTIFLHHLVTTYDFSVVQECEITRTPLPCFIKNLLVNISQSNPS
ncbi:unnamed protein product, partial [Cochlearia groenlandica]